MSSASGKRTSKRIGQYRRTNTGRKRGTTMGLTPKQRKRTSKKNRSDALKGMRPAKRSSRLWG